MVDNTAATRIVKKMLVKQYRQSEMEFLSRLNSVFTALFLLECILKLISFGVKVLNDFLFV